MKALVLVLLALGCNAQELDPNTMAEVLTCPWWPATEPLTLSGGEGGCWIFKATHDTKAARYGASACDVDDQQAYAVFENDATVQLWQRVGADKETLELEQLPAEECPQ